MTLQAATIARITWCCLLVAAAAVAQNGADHRQRLKAVEREFAAMRAQLETLRYIAASDPVDVRGRRKTDDFDQFAYTEGLQQRMKALLSQARAKDSAEAAPALEEAEGLMSHAAGRARGIVRYWQQTPAIFWRDHWKRIAEASGLPTTPPDPQLENEERTMLEQLAVGDFARAADESAPRIGARLHEAIMTARSEIMKSRDNADLKFVPYTGKCKNGDAGRKGSWGARAAQAPSAGLFYPPSSRRREEEGDIVVRARVAATGCPRDFAVLVSSGYPDLDAAAIKLAKASRYSPATDGDVPIEGQATFIVRFTLKGN